MLFDASSNRHKSKGRPLKVIISIITLWSFLFNAVHPGVAWAATGSIELSSVGSERPGSPSSLPAETLTKEGLFKELNVETFALPEYLGRIKYSYDAVSEGRAQRESQRVIIHIQDAHCNYAAQHKINEIIAYITRSYGIDTVNLEGGARDYDLSMFTRIADKNIRERVADDFVKEGLVSGAEYFAINNPGRVTLWGVEDIDLYLENLNIYKQSLAHKEQIDKNLKVLGHILANLKRHIYSDELLEFDLKYSQYKSDNLALKEYLAYIIIKAKQKTIDIRAFTNTYLLNQTLAQEDTIDFKRANIERDKLLDRLQKVLSKTELEKLILKTLEFKTEKISQEEFYKYIVKKADSVNVELKDFPALQDYIVYISLYAAIDKTRIIEEIDELEGLIRKAMYKDDRQRELGTLSKNLALTKNIFNISLTKEDYKYYRKNADSFSIRNYISFIEREAPRYQVTATLDDRIDQMDQYREDLSKFYECSLKRDRAFLKNMRFAAVGQESAANGRHKAILVTGGFHTENLCALFKESDVSYISIMPNFRNKDDYESQYFKLLAGEITGIEKRLYSVLSTRTTPRGSAIQIAAIQSRLLAIPVWSQRGLDAFRAAVLVRERLVKGEVVAIRLDDGKILRFAMEGGGVVTTILRPEDVKATETVVNLNEFLHWIHEADIDSAIAQAFVKAETALTPQEFVRPIADNAKERNEAAARIEAIAKLMRDKNKAARLSELASSIRSGVPIDLVNVGSADFEGHAGGMGIHINMRYANDSQRIADLIVHDAIAGVSGDHFIALEAERGHADMVSKKLEKAVLFDKPVWQMALEERMVVGRDFAQIGDKEHELLRAYFNMRTPRHELTEAVLRLAETFIKEQIAADSQLREFYEPYLAQIASDREFLRDFANPEWLERQIARDKETLADVSTRESLKEVLRTRIELYSGQLGKIRAQKQSFADLQPAFLTAVREGRVEEARDILAQLDSIPTSQLTQYQIALRRGYPDILSRLERESTVTQPTPTGAAAKTAAEEQITTAKTVIADLPQGTADIIVMPGSDIHKSQIFSVGKETERKLRKDYGQDTVPITYAYDRNWQANIKPVIESALAELKRRIEAGDKTARVLIYVAQEGRDIVENILSGKDLKDYRGRVSVIGEENVPQNGLIDEVMHIVLAKGLLNYERYRKGDYGRTELSQEAKIRLAEFIKTLISNPEAIDFGKDPDIINKILEGIIALRIKPIDFKEVVQWKKAQDEVLKAL